MRNEPLLTREELSFLQQLMDDSSPCTTAPEFTLNSSPDIQRLLASLGEHAQLTVQAQVGNQRLSFPLHLNQDDESRTLSLQLEAPQIFEAGRVERPWRATLDSPLNLAQRNGQASVLWVQQLSHSGALICSDDGSEPPRHFVLGLVLPGKPLLSLRGSRVRQLSSSQAAYRITPVRQSGIKRLHELLVQLRNQQRCLSLN